jgi:phosphoribosylanthranilate isomerase
MKQQHINSQEEDMEKIIVQIYEVQGPGEAERLIDLGVDHIGSVILDRENWCDPAIREVVRLTAGTPAKSSLIPLFSAEEEVFRVLDYYEPDIIHFCEYMPVSGGNHAEIYEHIRNYLILQQNIRNRYPGIEIMRSLPLPRTAAASAMISPHAIRNGIAALVAAFGPVSDFFMTDTVLGIQDGAGKETEQPVDGFVGITGETCDWDVAAWLVEISPLPVILAGGLSPENAFAALARVRPAGVDSCTRTNALDPRGMPVRFHKDFQRVQRLVAEVRRVEKTCKGEL